MEEEAGLWRWMQVLGERGRFSVFFFLPEKKVSWNSFSDFSFMFGSRFSCRPEISRTVLTFHVDILKKDALTLSFNAKKSNFFHVKHFYFTHRIFDQYYKNRRMRKKIIKIEKCLQRKEHLMIFSRFFKDTFLFSRIWFLFFIHV